MAKATPKISLNQSENIPYDKLVLSQKNVRRIKDGVTIEDLADDIALRGLIQSLNVRPLRDESGEETGQYEVPAGGRRYLALGILIKQKRMAKDEATPCIVNRKETTSAEDDSLAENMARETLHPLDEFRAFKVLFDQGLGEEEIAARYKVAPATVKQRLRLAQAPRALCQGRTQARAGQGVLHHVRPCPAGRRLGHRVAFDRAGAVLHQAAAHRDSGSRG